MTIFSQPLFMLRNSEGLLIPDTLRAKRETVEKMLLAEFPPGHVIYPHHTIATVRIEVIDG
ncbi:hypothetical protein [Bradyrhizobium sp.]